MNTKNIVFILLLMANGFAAYSNNSFNAAEIVGEDQIVTQLVVAGCEERAVKQLIKAIDTSLEARNNSDDEEQEEREWRSAVIKYGLIAIVGIVGIVGFVQMYKNREQSQQQNQQPSEVAQPVQQVPAVAPQVQQQAANQPQNNLLHRVDFELNINEVYEIRLSAAERNEARTLFAQVLQTDGVENAYDAVRRRFPNARFGVSRVWL